MTLRTLILLLAALALAGVARAASPGAKPGSDAPIQVEADHMSYDDARQINVFTGRVHMVRGPLTVLADRIVLREDKDGARYATADGEPARFRQLRESDGETIEGEASTLDYDSRDDTFTLRGQASMRRLEGARVTSEVFGNVIVYNGTTDFFTVDRGTKPDATPANPGGRVRVVIQPRASTGAGSAPAGTQPAPALRAAPALEPRGADSGSR